MAKVLTIVSSPVIWDDSSRIAEALTRRAMGLSTNTFELVRLNDLSIVKGCQRCLRCRNNDICELEDDLTPILKKIVKSDVVIFSTPLFFGRAISQYRLLEDRMCCFIGDGDRKPLSGKKFAVVVTSDIDDIHLLKEAEERMSSFLEGLGLENIGNIRSTINQRSDKDIIGKVEEIGNTI